jgi:hypothetical protein
MSQHPCDIGKVAKECVAEVSLFFCVLCMSLESPLNGFNYLTLKRSPQLLSNRAKHELPRAKKYGVLAIGRLVYESSTWEFFSRKSWHVSYTP